MSAFEKTIVLVVTTVAFIMLIAILVMSSMTIMEVHHLKAERPYVHRRPNGTLEIDIPERELDRDREPERPRYPRGNIGNVGNKGEKK